MKTILRTSYVLLFMFISFVSCIKEEDTVCNQPDPIIITNSPVEAGEALELHCTNIDNAAAYVWTGPDGFLSSDKDPVIEHASTANAGKYRLEVISEESCKSSSISDSVIITIPSAPCSPGANTGSLSGVGSFNFSAPTLGAQGGSYFVTSNSAGGDLEFEFAGTTKPVPGVYRVQPLGGEWLAGDVRVAFTASSSSWPTDAGQVYVNIENGKWSATFCSLTFSSLTFPGVSATGSANVTQQ